MKHSRYIPDIVAAAKDYRDHLLGKTFLIIGQSNKQKEISFLEVGFETQHFQHLVGCEGVGTTNADRFFDLCLRGRLATADFTVISHTKSKLFAFPSLARITNTVKMMGDYNGSGNFLYTEKIAGSTICCFGFVAAEDTPYLVPNTVLYEDARKLIQEPKQVMAIYQKLISEKEYPHRPVYLAKALKPVADKLVWPDEITIKIEKE